LEYDEDPNNNNKNEQTGRWTRQEHELFVEALKKYGKVCCRNAVKLDVLFRCLIVAINAGVEASCECCKDTNGCPNKDSCAKVLSSPPSLSPSLLLSA
jgi:hypothetical protein